VPLEYALKPARQQQVTVAMPILEAIEHAALRSGVPVDTRGSRVAALRSTRSSGCGTPSVSLASSSLLRWREAPASPRRILAWMLAHAPSETVILLPNRRAARPSRAAS
jgi:hypothetical protein